MKILKRAKALLGLGAVAGLVLSCQSILGIESHRQVTTPPYDGCSKGDCSGCLTSEDKDDCEGNTSGSSGSGNHGGSGSGGSGNHAGTSSGGNGNTGGNATAGDGTGGNGTSGRANGGDDTGGSGTDFDGGTDCTTLTDCYDQCVCAGVDPTDCTTACKSTPTNVCNYTDDCGSCESEIGSCSCMNADFGVCFYDATFGACPNDPGDCSTCQDDIAYCLCTGETPQTCYDAFTSNGAWATACAADACTSCSCDICSDQQILCADSLGCQNIVNCDITNHCTDVNCAACQGVVSNNEGVSGTPAGLAEALLGCRSDAACPCDAAR